MSTTETTAVMNQFAGGSIKPQTPLYHVGLNEPAKSTAQQGAGIVLKEYALTGQLVLRIRGDLAAAAEVVKKATGCELPDRLTFTGNPGNRSACSLAWLSPDEWRLLCPIDHAFELENSLRKELSGLAGVTHAVVNNSGGFTILELSGPDALSLLKKSTGYDVRDERFPIGKVVGTSFAKSAVTLLKVEQDRWQIWSRRSFSHYIWLWLQDAAREFGLNVLKE